MKIFDSTEIPDHIEVQFVKADLPKLAKQVPKAAREGDFKKLKGLTLWFLPDGSFQSYRGERTKADGTAAIVDIQVLSAAQTLSAPALKKFREKKAK